MDGDVSDFCVIWIDDDGIRARLGQVLHWQVEIHEAPRGRLLCPVWLEQSHSGAAYAVVREPNCDLPCRKIDAVSSNLTTLAERHRYSRRIQRQRSRNIGDIGQIETRAAVCRNIPIDDDCK